MTNCEKYAEILRDFKTPLFGVDNVSFIPKECVKMDCEACFFNNKYSCGDNRVEWLISETFERIDLTHGVFKGTATQKEHKNNPDTIIKKYVCDGIEYTEIFKG